MGFKLTSAQEIHDGQVNAIWNAGWHEAHASIVPSSLTALRTLESFQDRVAENRVFTRIALAGMDVLGFSMVKADELYQMYVSPKARGKGVAQALMWDAEARMRAQGHKTAWLACAVNNNRAARFYEKCGWVNAGLEEVALDTSEGSFLLEVWRFERALGQG
ncbi:MAG: GNAT family N-acetyltransferase [Pseudomonadota bacterium]